MNSSVAVRVKSVSLAWAVLRFLRAGVHRLALALGYFLLALFSVAAIQAAFFWLSSPERQSQAKVLAHLPHDYQLPPWNKQVADFDGDGVPDELTADWYRIEYLLGGGSSGMVLLKSGETGETLFAHAQMIPFLSGGWHADFDGDGLVDVVLRDRHGWTLYGFDGGQR